MEQVDEKINRYMAIDEAVNKHPETIEVFMRYGLGCIGCHVAAFENIEQGAMGHGINVDDLMRDLNAAVAAAEKANDGQE